MRRQTILKLFPILSLLSGLHKIGDAWRIFRLSPEVTGVGDDVADGNSDGFPATTTTFLSAWSSSAFRVGSLFSFVIDYVELYRATAAPIIPPSSDLSTGFAAFSR